MGPCHGAVSPKERETYKVGTVGARIFPKRVWSGGLRVTSDLAPLVEDSRKAVRSSERAELTLLTEDEPQLPRQVRWKLIRSYLPSSSAFPESEAGRLLRCRLLSVYSLRPACSASRLCDLLHRRVQQLHCLRCCFDCYRTRSRAGLPRYGSAPFHGALRLRDGQVGLRCREFPQRAFIGIPSGSPVIRQNAQVRPDNVRAASFLIDNCWHRRRYCGLRM